MDRSSLSVKASHNAFNDMLNSTIERGQGLLTRNFINYDYVESERKDQQEPCLSSSLERRSQRYESRASASKSPLKDYISSKIDQHISKLKGSSARPQETEPMYFESQIEDQQNYREGFDEIHHSQNEGAVGQNVAFEDQYDSRTKHKQVNLAGSELTSSHFRHRPEVGKVATRHHDSPIRDSRVFNYTEHEVRPASSLTGTLRSTAGGAQGFYDAPQEDAWAKTSRSIEKLHEKHSGLERSRLDREGPQAAEERERALFERSANQSHTYADKLRAQESNYISPEKRFNETVRLRALEDMTPAQPGLGESVVSQSNSFLINRYHTMKQNPPRVSRQTLKFAASRINPPRCLLDVLDALFSLVYGVYDKVDHGYFATKDRKYYEYKAFFHNIDELHDTLAHLKLFVETQGLPLRNITQADEALVRYKKTVKRIEARPYIDSTEELSAFVLYFLEYYNILRVRPSHPETEPRASEQERRRKRHPYYLSSVPEELHPQRVERDCLRCASRRRRVHRGRTRGPDPHHCEEKDLGDHQR